MEFLYFLEKIRTPVLDAFFSFITRAGEETLFLAIAIIFFWCVNKREGYYMLITGLVGIVINQAAKLIFKVPRPWIKDPNFTIVESARAEATGYSFPSGHTQNVVGTYGAIGRSSKRKAVRVAMVIIIILVAFSRMYLGVHTPLDILFSLGLGTVIVFLLYPLFSSEEKFHKFMPYITAISVLISIGLLLFVFLVSKEGHDEENLESGMKTAAMLFGCTCALVPVYVLDRKYIKFETSARWYAQIIKFTLGLIGVLAIKEGLSAPLSLLFDNEYIARGVRYFLVVMFAGVVWPMTFSYFSKMKIEKLDNLFKNKKQS